MADPILDEDLIIHFLRSPVVPEMMHQMQSGAVQTLLDLYDRKVTRDEFCEAAGQCVVLYSSAARMLILDSMRQLYIDQALTPAAFDEAVVGLQRIMRIQTAGVIEIVERLKLCPTSQDKVH